MTKVDAELDPWCTVAIASKATVIFGYAHCHPRTGGLAWTRTSVVVEIDEAGGSALTASGTIYRLGRRFHMDDVSAYEVEARLALWLLLGIGPAPTTILATLGNTAGAKRWLAACKVARHLALPCPAPDPTQVETFLSENRTAYIELRCKTGVH